MSAAIIDAHAGVPGAGAAEPGTLVMVMGTSSCHMINATERRFVPGVAGVVEGGILPGCSAMKPGRRPWAMRSTGCGDCVGQENFDRLEPSARECRRRPTACAASTGSTAAARR